MPLVFFPPTFFKESRAPPPESAGNPRCRVHPAMVPTELPTDDRGPRPSFSPFLGRNGDPRRAGGATGRCAPRPRKSLDHPKGTQYRTAPPPGAGRATGRCAPRTASEPPTQRVRSPVPPLAGGSVRTAAGSHLQGGFPPGPGRGSRLSLGESPDTKSRGGGPPPPFDGPLATARSFWGWVPHCSGRWAITVPMYVP